MRLRPGEGKLKALTHAPLILPSDVFVFFGVSGHRRVRQKLKTNGSLAKHKQQSFHRIADCTFNRCVFFQLSRLHSLFLANAPLQLFYLVCRIPAWISAEHGRTEADEPVGRVNSGPLAGLRRTTRENPSDWMFGGEEVVTQPRAARSETVSSPDSAGFSRKTFSCDSLQGKPGEGAEGQEKWDDEGRP